MLGQGLLFSVALAICCGSGMARGDDVALQSALAAGHCESCHAQQQRLMGPSFEEIAVKYRDNPEAQTLLMRSVREGSSGVWGSIPMMPFSQDMISDAELGVVLQWMLSFSQPPATPPPAALSAETPLAETPAVEGLSIEESAAASQPVTLPSATVQPATEQPVFDSQATASQETASQATAAKPSGAQNPREASAVQGMAVVLEGIPGHRPLRSNQGSLENPAPSEPAVFHGYPEAPAYRVVAREQELTFYPCAQCHQHMPPSPEPRKLAAAPHPAALDHGEGRMWCVDCHSLTERNNLRTIQDEPVSFNESDRLCGQCHAQRQKDWVFGGHGKRVAGWGEDRTIYACTHCHNPHSPSVKPRAPSAPPPVRAGLQPMPEAELEYHSVKAWETGSHPSVDKKPDEKSGDEQ